MEYDPRGAYGHMSGGYGGQQPPPPPPPSPPAPKRTSWARTLVIAGGIIAIAVVAAIAVVRSRDDGSDSTEPAISRDGDISATTTAPPAENPAEEYLQLLTENELGKMPRMLELATPGSPAHLYATHQIALARATGGTAATMTGDGQAFEICSDVLDNAGNQVEQCTTVAGFEINADTGLLESFTVDGANIRDRITAGQAATGSNVTVQVISSYQSAGGDLIVNVDIRNDRPGPIAVADYDWAYVAPDGRQIAPQDSGLSGPDVEPGATAGFLALFPQVATGGTLRFVAFADDFATEVRFDVPTAG